MPSLRVCWGLLMLLAAVPLAGGCARRVPPAPPVYSNDPKLIPKLDPILALPQYPKPQPNGYEVFEALTKRVNKSHEVKADFTGGTYHPVPHATELAAAPAQLADNAAILTELRLALKMEWLYPHPPKADLLSPEIHLGMYLARLMLQDAELQTRDAQVDAAVGNLLDVLTLAVKLPRGGPDIAWLVGRGRENMAFKQLTPLIAGGRLAPERLRDVPAQLQQLEGQRVPLREIIAFEYECQGPQTLNLAPRQFMQLVAGRNPPLWLSLAVHLPGAGAAIRGFISGRLPDLMRWDAQIAKLAARPYYEIRDQIPADPGDTSDMLVFYPIPASTLARQADSQVRWRAAQIMIALELYRSSHGAYPPTLQPLHLTADQLQDPFSGQPLVCRPQGDSYTLYSVGEDGKDNGGKATNKADEPNTDLVIWPIKPPSQQ